MKNKESLSPEELAVHKKKVQNFQNRSHHWVNSNNRKKKLERERRLNAALAEAAVKAD